MEKEGAFLSDRPRSISVGETLSDNLRIITVGDGARLKKLRRSAYLHRNAYHFESMVLSEDDPPFCVEHSMRTYNPKSRPPSSRFNSTMQGI